MQNTLRFSVCALCATLFVLPSQAQTRAPGKHQITETGLDMLSTPAGLAIGSAGYVAFEGEGVIVTLSDRQPSGTKQHPVPPPYSAFVHDTHVAMLINDLRSAGANAITVNGVRLTAETGIHERGITLLVGDKPIQLPVRVEAVGVATSLRDNLKRQGGFVDRMRKSGPRVEVVTSPKIFLAAAPLPVIPGAVSENAIGVIVRLSDRNSALGKSGSAPNLVHDFDVEGVVQELRIAGAKAIAVNGILLSKATAIKAVGTELFVGVQKISIPVRVEATGNAKTLLARLKIKGGALARMQASGPQVQLWSATQLSPPLASF